jgi:S-adenosylmethionine hydrolase
MPRQLGNLITNIPTEKVAGAPADAWVVETAGNRVPGPVNTYGQRPPGTLAAWAGSTGWPERAAANGGAGRLLSAGPGSTVWLRRR